MFFDSSPDDGQSWTGGIWDALAGAGNSVVDGAADIWNTGIGSLVDNTKDQINQSLAPNKNNGTTTNSIDQGAPDTTADPTAIKNTQAASDIFGGVNPLYVYGAVGLLSLIVLVKVIK